MPTDKAVPFTSIDPCPGDNYEGHRSVFLRNGDDVRVYVDHAVNDPRCHPYDAMATLMGNMATYGDELLENAEHVRICHVNDGGSLLYGVAVKTYDYEIRYMVMGYDVDQTASNTDLSGLVTAEKWEDLRS